MAVLARRCRAKVNDPTTWSTLEEARAAYLAGGFDGIAFVFAPNGGLFGIDYDHCRDPETGELNLRTVGPTSAQLGRNEIDDAEQGLMWTQLLRTMDDHDLRAAAEEAEDDPDPDPGSRRRKRS